MENFIELPIGYKPILSIDLQKDKKTALIVNLIAGLIALLLVLLGIVFVPILNLLDFGDGLAVFLAKFAVISVGAVAYIILHELVHGIFMKHYSKTKVNYGFTLLYAYAGSKAYFNKRDYIIIALAPVVIWGIVLLIISCVVGQSWFWCVYFIQILNLSGAAGDLYVTCKFSKLPKDILVQDSGVAMTVYSREQ